MREEGHVFSGEAFVVPKGGMVDVNKLQEAGDRIDALDWRIYDIVIVPVPSLQTTYSSSNAPQPQGLQAAVNRDKT